MWHLISFVLAMIGALVALSGEPMGAIGFIPMLIASVSYDVKNHKKE